MGTLGIQERQVISRIRLSVAHFSGMQLTTRRAAGGLIAAPQDSSSPAIHSLTGGCRTSCSVLIQQAGIAGGCCHYGSLLGGLKAGAVGFDYAYSSLDILVNVLRASTGVHDDGPLRHGEKGRPLFGQARRQAFGLPTAEHKSGPARHNRCHCPSSPSMNG